MLFSFGIFSSTRTQAVTISTQIVMWREEGLLWDDNGGGWSLVERRGKGVGATARPLGWMVAGVTGQRSPPRAGDGDPVTFAAEPGVRVM